MISPSSKQILVICGANQQLLDDMAFTNVRELRNKLREVLNITEEHKIVLVNGKQITNETDDLTGGETVEFKKPAGEKG